MTVDKAPILRVIERYDDCLALRSAWNELVASHSREILHFDVTSTFEWSMTLWDTFLNKSDQTILSLQDGDEILGILPLYRSNKRIHGVRCRVLSPFTELFSGRSGFLLRNYYRGDLAALVDELRRIPNWDVFLFTLVEGSPCDMLWQEFADERRMIVERCLVQTSPYIPLDGTWQDYFASLPKKFASGRIRSADKRLRAKGKLVYREFREVSQVSEYKQALLDVEVGSWKESAGTSLTLQALQQSFHLKLIDVAADNGWLWGHVLQLDNEPIAYLHGLIYNKVFCNLKSSFKEKYREMSPGHVLRATVLQRLYAQGVGLYDFMGVFDDHKRVWTDKCYSRVTYALYNRTMLGRAARLGQKLRRVLQQRARLFGG